MWLLPYLAKVSAAAVHLYYRASRGGTRVPQSGPVLIVGNHPNSLLDPAFLAWVADRPVRFLAKAPLFTDRRVGWLIRGSGSIPVYRRTDDPTQMSRNDETFRAVHQALAAGSAVALFPEGVSHSEPGMVPLKTGAARIALGAAALIGCAFPIIPVGLVFRAKDRFRSEAHAVAGEPVAWDDVALKPVDDVDAVRELTERIEHAMRTVTLNLARWEDESVVRTAEAVWAASRDADESAAARVARLATASDAVARLRASGDERWIALARDVEEHARTLRVLGMRPVDLELDTGVGAAARWAAGRLRLIGIAQLIVAIAAVVLFWIPYRLTGVIAGMMTRHKDTISTHRVLAGAPLFVLWVAMLAAIAAYAAGWIAGIVTLIALPVVAVGGLYAAEHWRWTFLTARRWLVLRRRDDPRIASLRARQADLARRLDEALAAHQLTA